MSSLFYQRTIAIATMHGKEKVIEPIISQAFDCVCIVPEWIDTDQFGTFTRDIKRRWDMLQAARAKIHKAMEITWCDIAIASEWSFGADPMIPFIQSNLELTLLYDKKNNIEVRWHYRTNDLTIKWTHVSSVEEALCFAEEQWFPEYGIIVRRRKEWKRGIYKDISTEQELIKRVEWMLKRPFTSQIYVETDMRAHQNPARMTAIEWSIKNLVENAQSLCPECEMPWFIIKSTQWHLLCGWCGQPTRIPSHEVKLCDACGYTQKIKITIYGDYADPGRCGYCNP